MKHENRDTTPESSAGVNHDSASVASTRNVPTLAAARAAAERNALIAAASNVVWLRAPANGSNAGGAK